MVPTASRPIPIRARSQRTALPGDRAGDHAGEQAAQRERAEHQPGDRLVAGVVGERDRGHLERAEEAAQGDRPDRQRHEQSPRHRAADLRGVVRVGRWLRPALHREGEGADRADGDGRARARPAGAKEVARKVTSAGPVTNTTSSATLSTANAVCRSLSEVSRCAQRARTMVPICGIEAPASAPHTCGQGSAHSWTIETIIRMRGEREDDRVDVQHAALAEPVGQPAVRDGEERVADDVRRRDLAGQRVGAGQRADEQDDAERHHRDRQPRHEAGGGEGESTGVGEHPAVGGEHSIHPTESRQCFSARGTPS